jgi:polyferredoxin
VSSRLLKWLRIVVALAVFAALTTAFVDFRELVPWKIGHWLSEIQFVPSLVALLTGASLSLACIIIAVVTLAVGRVYCSAICPLGILQDIINRLTKWVKRKSRPASYSRPHTWLRQTFLWATIIAAVAGWGGFALALLDPYSNFGRIASDIFRPLATLANNSVVGLADTIGWHGLFRVEPRWAVVGALHQPVILLILLFVLVVFGGRLYCNTLCPVGTLLGWLSKRAAFRLQIEKSACAKCAACMKVCKAQCIDLHSSSIDFSRCVACYNCVDVCEEHGIGYRFAWINDEQPAPNSISPPRTQASMTVWSSAFTRLGRIFSLWPPKGGTLNTDVSARPELVPNPQRREFLAQTIAGIIGAAGIARWGTKTGSRGRSPHQLESRGRNNFSPVICPPGSASVERFADRCTACHLCISECPTGVLQPAFMEYGLLGIMKPRMDFNVAFCNFDCVRCGEVCPDGAIDLLDVATKHLVKIGEARFYPDQCVVVTNSTDCAACSEHCPTKAVFTVPYGNNLRLPSLNNDLCIGCGACENVCPAKPDKAIVVTGWREHGWAKKSIESKATMPKPTGDFPF